MNAFTEFIIAVVQRGLTTTPSFVGGDEKNASYAQLEPRVLYSASPIDGADFDGEADEPPDEVDLASISQHGAEAVFGSGNLAFEEGVELNEFEFEFIEPSKPTTLIVVDSQVDDLDQLLEGIELNAAFRLEVLVLDAERDGIAQISDRLATLLDVESIHVVAHGADGAVQLGNALLTADSLAGYAGQLSHWREALTSDADLLFYGCNLAASSEGEELIDSMAALCDCDVAASDDVTGHAELGGDWEFEYLIGTVEADLAFTADLQRAWVSTLDITSTFQQGDGNGYSETVDTHINQGNASTS